MASRAEELNVGENSQVELDASARAGFTTSDTSSGVKQKQSNEKELPTSENENTTLPNDTLPSNHEETLSQEQNTNLENVKRIMSSEKTTLPSLRKIETTKINHILPYIPTNNITELNELIYAGAKLVCEKIGIPSKSTKKQSKLGWEIRLETQIIPQNGNTNRLTQNNTKKNIKQENARP